MPALITRVNWIVAGSLPGGDTGGGLPTPAFRKVVMGQVTNVASTARKNSRHPITPKCPNCGSDELQKLAPGSPPGPPVQWWCSDCCKVNDGEGLIIGSLDLGPPIDEFFIDSLDLESAMYHAAKRLANAFDADSRRALFEEFQAFYRLLEAEFLLAWERCDVEYAAIRTASEDLKVLAFQYWISRWIKELIRLMRLVIDYVRPLPSEHSVPRAERADWLFDASEMFWLRLRRAYRDWIIAAAFEPGSQIAPEWLWMWSLPAERRRSEAATKHPSATDTNKLLDTIEEFIHQQVSEARRRMLDQALTAPDTPLPPVEQSRPDSVAEPRSTDDTTRTRRRRIGRGIDLRKKTIAEIKAEHPGISALQVCKQMDALSERLGQNRREQLQPLDSWMTRAPGKRRWTDLFSDRRTKKTVGKYVYTVPPLRITKKP